MISTALLFLPMLFGALFASAWLANKLIPLPENPVKYVAIDGIRGYLAFFVFLHHGWIWQEFLQTGNWEAPSFRLFHYFGQGAVSFFFMITSFLFFGRLLDKKTIDWRHFWRSRWFRIAPLYYFSTGFVFLITFLLTGFEIKTDASTFARSILDWLLFTIPGIPDINGLDKTYRIDAGVTWSLPYEWLFYLALPMIALMMRRKVPMVFFVPSCIGLVAVVLLLRPGLGFLYPFIGGMIAAWVVRKENLKEKLTGKWISVLIIAISIGLALNTKNAYKPIPVLLNTLLFTAIACGNTVFGILKWRISRQIGHISYSIYLLHGIVLFTFFTFVADRPEQFEPWQHWVWITALVPLVVFICQLTYRFIEMPGIARGKK